MHLKEDAIAYFGVISRHLPERAEGGDNKVDIEDSKIS
jgi:hypothetical protein